MFRTARIATKIQRNLSNTLLKNKKTFVKCTKTFSHSVGRIAKNENHANLNEKFSIIQQRQFVVSTQPNKNEEKELDSITYDKISNETLESLSDYFDELVEAANHLLDADISNRDGVLTVKFGENYGTYVINRQTPNKQIWLSSPTSGPKRYDFINGKWIYKHDGRSLHALLNEEIPAIVKSQVNFENCSHSGQ